MQWSAWARAWGRPEKVFRQNLHRQRVTRIDSMLPVDDLDMFVFKLADIKFDGAMAVSAYHRYSNLIPW